MGIRQLSVYGALSRHRPMPAFVSLSDPERTSVAHHEGIALRVGAQRGGRPDSYLNT